MEDDGHKVDSAEDVRKKPDINSQNIEKDETWVMVGLSRRQCSHPVEIFGSNIRNSNTIAMTVKKASRSRQHGTDYYHGHKKLIEIEMTPVQFAQMITSANYGDGVPCSLRQLGDEYYEYKTGRDMGDTVKSDMKGEFTELADRCKLAESQINAILKRPGRVSAVEKDEIATNLYFLAQAVKSNIPFMEKQFKKTMAKAVLEAKREVQAYAEMTVHQLGLAQLELPEAQRLKTPELMVGEVIDAESEPPDGDG